MYAGYSRRVNVHRATIALQLWLHNVGEKNLPSFRLHSSCLLASWCGNCQTSTRGMWSNWGPPPSVVTSYSLQHAWAIEAVKNMSQSWGHMYRYVFHAPCSDECVVVQTQWWRIEDTKASYAQDQAKAKGPDYLLHFVRDHAIEAQLTLDNRVKFAFHSAYEMKTHTMVVCAHDTWFQMEVTGGL